MLCMYVCSGAAGEGRQRVEGSAAKQNERRHLAHVLPLLQNNRHAHHAYIHTLKNT